jgi:hypothetical protein
LPKGVHHPHVRCSVVVGIAAFCVALFPTFAGAAIETTTTGKVCCPHLAGHLENFGGYTFKGRTKPSLKGQFVYFQYKRASADRWRPFKVGLGGSSGNGFYILNKDRPRDSINRRHRWSVFFTPSVPQGKWKIRALFPRQDGYGRSFVTKRYSVSGSD